MQRHDCIQDKKVRQLCDVTGRMDERVKTLEKQSDEIFTGDNSIKSRLIRTEDSVESINKNIKESFSGMRWFIGILVTIQIAAFGGLSLYTSHFYQQQAHQVQSSDISAGTDIHEYLETEG